MAVMWTKAYETSTVGDMPTNAANSWSQGFTIRSGTLENLTLRYDLTFGATPVTASDVSALVDSLRVIVNGETVHDFTASYANRDALFASQYSYLLNSIGGRIVEECDISTPTERVGYITIPIGKVLSNTGQNRIECVVNWAQANGAIASGKLEWWCRYNSSAQTMTTLVPATSFTHTTGPQQVIARCPTNMPAGTTIAGVLITNTSETDQLGTQGVRVVSSTDYGITAEQWRMINGDAMNRILYNNGSVGLSDGGAVAFNALQMSQEVLGSLFIPLFDLTLGDVQLIVDSSAATTRRYQLVLVTPIGGNQKQEQSQTARLVGNTSKAVLGNDLQ